MDEPPQRNPQLRGTGALERRLATLRDTLVTCLRKSKALEVQLRQEQEAARRDSTELMTIYGSAPLGLALVDRELRYLRVNETLAEFNGLPAAEHLGRTIPELFPHLRELATSITATILATGKPVLKAEFTGPNPSRPHEVRQWTTSWLPLREPDGTISAFHVGVTEITEQKRTEAVLTANAQAQEFLIATALRLLKPIERQDLFDFITARLYSVSEGGIVLFSEFEPTGHRTLLRAMGMSPEEQIRASQILGRDPRGITFTFPEQVRADVLPGEFAYLPGGIWELTFHQLPKDLCEALERALNTRRVYAMACSVERDLLGTVAILTKDDHLPNKRLIETVVTEAALALKRKRAEETLRSERNFFDTVIDTQAAVVAILDNAHRVVRINRAYYALTGFEPGTMTGLDFTELMEPDSRRSVKRQLARLVDTSPTGEFETLLRVREAPLRRVAWRATVNRNDYGQVDNVIATGIDITERKQMEERTRYLAEHDALTDLPNRRLLLELLDQALGSARRATRKMAVMFLDLDHFKFINDNLGHKVGDDLLKEVAHRLSGRLRRSDIVSRLGGDEFALLLSDVSRAEQVGEVADEVLRTFKPPFSLADQELHVSASLGISLFPDDSDTAEGLLRRADLAMYEAKEQGRNTFRFYNPVVDTRAKDRARIETSLRQALDHDGLRLVYQPEFDLRTGEIVGVEALVRWQHPELGVLDPERFIPVAEETELIAMVDDWVLARVCEQARRWLDQGARPVHIAINLSARRFESQTLLTAVRNQLASSRIDPRLLELELTEYTVMHHIEQNIERLRALVALGVSIVVDDFGTGYSSLSYLKQLPIRKLKIDKSFVRDITSDPNDRAIVNAVTTLAHTLNKRVIAEGVENEQQRDFLVAHDCDEAQGYYFNRPLPPEELFELIRRPGPGA